MPSTVQSPSPTLRSKRTDCAARSGSTTALTVTGSMLATVPPSVGVLTLMLGEGTRVERTPLGRVWPALSRTTARYCSGVPVRSVEVSWKTWYGAVSSVPIEVQRPLPERTWKVTSLNDVPATSARTCMRPRDSGAGAGAASVTFGACFDRASRPSAR